jgi:hypothetical protein
MKSGLMSSLGTVIASGALCSVGVLANLLLLAVAAFPFEWAWNAALPRVMRVPVITYWEALGVLALWVILRTVGNGVKLSATFRDGL